MNRPITTLFLLTSVDGKISTGSTDKLDFDKDFPRIGGIKEGLQQYYALEKTTDLHSLNSGRVLAKVGANKPQKNLVKFPVSFLIIDNEPHLNKTGVDNFLRKSKKLYIITTNKNHPAFSRQDAPNLEIVFYKREIDFVDLFQKLKEEYGIQRMTIQTGGTLNSIFLRKKLIDKLSLVVASALVGGKDTPSLIDGKSIVSVKELSTIKALRLTAVKKLHDSYLHLKYDIINDTKVY
ncbi:MAG TPA: dihydrofolate reductase family protein [Candidatus Nanoarchaeia archaeon]|nr:dihydrofolate reductase family protein [Candidatus Nanoarchaeia archaeon]